MIPVPAGKAQPQPCPSSFTPITWQTSELITQGKFKNTRISRARHLAKVAGAIGGLNAAEIRVIENVKALRAEFNHVSLGDVEVFIEGHIEVDHSRSSNGTRGRIAKVSVSRCRESRGIEPLLCGLLAAGKWISHFIRAGCETLEGNT